MPNQRADPIADVAAGIVADDPQIRARMQRLVNALLADAERTVRLGSPQERAVLMKQVVPALLRSMQGADANASEAADKAAYDRMMAAMRGEVAVADVEPVTAEDAPPVAEPASTPPAPARAVPRKAPAKRVVKKAAAPRKRAPRKKPAT